MKTNLVLSRDTELAFRKRLGKENTLTETFASVAELFAKGNDWLQSLAASAPFLKDIGDAAEEIKVIAVAQKLLHRWVGVTDPYQLGALACTLAYQQAAFRALENIHGKFLRQTGRDTAKTVARQLRYLEPLEALSLETFDLEHALQHQFVIRANETFRILLSGTMLSTLTAERTSILKATRDNFLSELRLLLNHERTADRFAPFKNIMDKGTEQKRVQIALAQHVNYQYALFAERPLLNREPFSLRDIYEEPDCVKRLWRELQAGNSAYVLRAEGRTKLLETVYEMITDVKFNDLIVVQGLAGVGKSSFTLSLCAKLREEGFVPLRLRMSRYHVGTELYAALSDALEFEDQQRLNDLEFTIEDQSSLLNKKLLRTGWVNDSKRISQYVLILDGWDELELSDNQAFVETVKNALSELRDKLLKDQERPMIRVVVTGRPLPQHEKRAELTQTTPILIVQPMLPEQLRAYAERLRKARAKRRLLVEQPDDWQMPAMSQLDPVFARYQKEFEELRDELERREKEKNAYQPKDLPDLVQVLGLPLLTFLAMRVMAQEVAKSTEPEALNTAMQELLDEPTTLYRRLTDLVCPAAANPMPAAGAPAPDRSARLQGKALRAVLQQTAASICLRQNRGHVSEGEWRARCKKFSEFMSAPDAPDNLSLAALMVSFYFKDGHASQKEDQSIEFVHKSFREYLFAEYVIESLKALASADKRDFVMPPPHHDFTEKAHPYFFHLSRHLAHLLAPEWLTPEIIKHLEKLWMWELKRAPETDADQSFEPDVDGTQPLSLKRWENVRDNLVKLWAWWVDGAHLTPQVSSDANNRPVPQPSFTHELILNWARDIREKDNLSEAVTLALPTQLDARLGDGLFRLTSMAHALLISHKDDFPGWPESGSEFFVPWLSAEDNQAINEKRRANAPAVSVLVNSQILPVSTVKEKDCPSYQTLITPTPGNSGWTLFAPSGERWSDNQYGTRVNFREGIARINADSSRINGPFPSSQFLPFCDLSGASLYGARLDGASLDGASLDRADLSETKGLTEAQLLAIWSLSEETRLPAEFAALKEKLLARQQEREAELAAAAQGEETEEESPDQIPL